MAQIPPPMIGNIDLLLESEYKQILELRKTIDFEDNMSTKLNLRDSQAHKSTWKLNTQEENISRKANFNRQIFNDETRDIENCKQEIKNEKDSKKLTINKKRENIKEKKSKLESKFFNFYEDYDSKILLANTQEYRKIIHEKKENLLRTLQQEEKICRQNRDTILINSSYQYILETVFKPLLFQDNKLLSENQTLKKGNKDINLKRLQNKGTIQEFSIEMSKYNV